MRTFERDATGRLVAVEMSIADHARRAHSCEDDGWCQRVHPVRSMRIDGVGQTPQPRSWLETAHGGRWPAKDLTGR